MLMTVETFFFEQREWMRCMYVTGSLTCSFASLTLWTTCYAERGPVIDNMRKGPLVPLLSDDPGEIDA